MHNLSRSVTKDPVHGRSAVTSWWSTTNLAEAYPGVLTPLGWTVAGPATEVATRTALHSIGALTSAERRVPGADEDRIFNVFYGRIATRVGFFCEVGDRMPGTSGPAVAEQIFGFVPPGAMARSSWRRYPTIAAKFPGTFVAAPGRSRRARECTAPWWREEIRRAPALTLEQARDQFRKAVDRFTMHLTVDGTALLAGTQPVHDQLARLALEAGVSDAELVIGFGSHEESELVNDLWACSRGQLDLDTVVERYGYHGPNEGEVSAQVWREASAPLQRALDAYATMPDGADPIAASVERRLLRQRSAREFLASLPAHKRPAARIVLQLAATYLPLRGKVGRLQALDVVRASARRIGTCLAMAGDLADGEDVFFLTAAEVLRPLPGDAREIVDERRARHDRYLTLTLRRSWQGEPTPTAVVDSTTQRAEQASIHGVGVSPGIVEGQIRVVTDPSTDDIEPGDILVARTTDPSWAALMFVSAALVVEIGGPLSHAAVVARELGVPCIMGVDGATSRLHNGDYCRVDGSGGQITLLARGHTQP